MKKFKIPVTWEVCGTVEIEADNLTEAIQKFDEQIDDISLPLDWDYIDGSFTRESEELASLINNLK